MSQPDQDRSGRIVITRSEAFDPHVDSMLKRHMSLRGEAGITRERGRKWYYQNWLVFMVGGALAALIVWAILEPYLDDYLYLQGTIESIQQDPNRPRMTRGNMFFELQADAQAKVRVRGQDVWIMEAARAQDAEGDWQPYNAHGLKVGQDVGLYVESQAYAQSQAALGEALAVALLVVPNPGPPDADESELSLDELAARCGTASMLLFPLVAALVGLAIGSVEGLICRLPRRAILGALIGLVVGFIGGFVSFFIANLVYTPLNRMAMEETGGVGGTLSTWGFFIQMTGRGLAWCLAGMAMGLGQGVALRSGRLLLYGFLGGLIGGLLGGLLFDPIDLLLLGYHKPSAHVSRVVGLLVIGGCVGAMIGVVELLARDAWLKMVKGPLSGKEFLLFKDTMNVGASPRSDIYLFNDETVADTHAVIRAVGENYEIENFSEGEPTCINGRSVKRSRLRSGDQIAIGRTALVFQRRQRS